MTNDSISRRKFLAAGTVLSGALLSSRLPAFGRSSDAAPVRLGIIGTGNRGGGIAHILQKIPGVTLNACCDIYAPNLDAAVRLAAPGAAAYKDYRRLLEDKSIDAVIIATPLYLHYPMAVGALDAGKHVYLEKTMTYTIDEALSLERKMKGSKLILQVGHQNRYFAMYHRIWEVIAQNWLGNITHFECQYHRNSNWRNPVPDPSLERQINWRMYRQYSGGLMAELCAHQIDIVNWILGTPPVKVMGMGDVNFWKDGRETCDNVRAIFEYPNGVKASVSSILSNAYRGFSIRVLGSKATMEIQRDKTMLYAETSGNEKAVVDGVTGATKTNWTEGEGKALAFQFQDDQKRDPTAYALMDFADCIRNNRLPVSNVHSGREAAICVHLANKSIDNGQMEYWQSGYSA